MNPCDVSRSNFADLNSILDALQECNTIRYAAYRTAAKLRLLQGALFVDKLPLRIICNVFERHNLHQTENLVHLDEKDLEPILHDVYFVVKKEYYKDIDINHSVYLMTNFLFAVFDKRKKSSVQVLCSKVGLVILCAAKPREKYQYLFNQLADHNSCLSKKKLDILLKKILNVTEYVNEELYFRQDLIPGTVESCFQNNIGTLGVSEDDFISWLVQDPQILVWLSTLYRMQLSETVCHNAKCSVCRIYPIIGLRYRCLRCLCYNQCQSCFFTGKYNKKHKLTHPVQEYCFQVTSRQSTKAFLLTIKNRLLKSNTKLQYLPAQKVLSNYVDTFGESTKLLDDIDISSRTLVNGSRISLQNQPQKELHSIITQLEKESEKIIPQIEKLCRKDFNQSECQIQLKNCLLNHKDQVEQQVRRLKLLKDYLGSVPKSKILFESTPVVHNTTGKTRLNETNDGIEGISPITRKKTFDKDCYLSLKKMMWDKYDIVDGTVCTSWEECSDSAKGSEIPELHTIPIDNSLAVNDLSTWLGGSSLKELDYSTNRGFTFLFTPTSNGCSENTSALNIEAKDADALQLQNERYFHDIEYYLEDILNKLERLTCNESNDRAIAPENKTDEDYLSDIDALLVGLIKGIDKLVSD